VLQRGHRYEHTPDLQRRVQVVTEYGEEVILGLVRDFSSLSCLDPRSGRLDALTFGDVPCRAHNRIGRAVARYYRGLKTYMRRPVRPSV
jgi:hypothetical protein